MDKTDKPSFYFKDDGPTHQDDDWEKPDEIAVTLRNPSITRYIQPPPVISASDMRRRIAELEAEGLIGDG